jgi:hypothetical protein
VPAPSSSAIPAALTQLAHAEALQPAEAPHLLAYLATIRDPRARRGRRHPLVAVLAMAAAAVLTGARSLTAIAEWAGDAPQVVRAALGARREAPEYWAVPAEATIRRTLGRVDPEALTGAIGAWLTDRDRPDQRRRAVAVDGKTLRGAGCWPNARSTAPPARCPASPRCLRRWTWPAPWSPRTRYTDLGITRLMPRSLLCRGGGRWRCCWG